MASDTYQTLLCAAMSPQLNGRRRISIRDLAKATGYSYEHVRKICAGEPVGSREMNRRICEALALEEEKMWALAARAKIVRRFKDDAINLAPPDDDQMKSLWPDLSAKNKAELRKIVEGMALARRVLASRRPRGRPTSS